MRYAQLAYEGKEAEQPEKIVTTDIPLIVAILVWGLTVISILYILWLSPHLWRNILS